jgi:hypothetical protein
MMVQPSLEKPSQEVDMSAHLGKGKGHPWKLPWVSRRRRFAPTIPGIRDLLAHASKQDLRLRFFSIED